MHIPNDIEEWSRQIQTDIVIRRKYAVKDAIKEAKKRRFDPTKLICVWTMCRLLIGAGQ